MDCFACWNTAQGDALPPRERVYLGVHWRVAHSYSVALRGWLVVLPIRHVESIGELTAEEAASLGGLLRALSLALVEVTGAVKTYVMQFGEAEGHRHLHFHVVPRRADLPRDRRGPKVMSYLLPGEAAAVPAAEMDRVALEVSAALTAAARPLD
jgi:diadenosine tetraphosphate (Ap4A) HIT family hydrolase